MTRVDMEFLFDLVIFLPRGIITFYFCLIICWYFFIKFVFPFLTNFLLLHVRIKDKLS